MPVGGYRLSASDPTSGEANRIDPARQGGINPLGCEVTVPDAMQASNLLRGKVIY
jgi:hypothetical protein